MTENSYPNDSVINCMCEGNAGRVYLGYGEGIAEFWRDGIKQEYDCVDWRTLNPAPFPQGLLYVDGTLIACRNKGIEVVTGQEKITLPAIDASWFERPSQKVPKSSQNLLTQA